jgi:predicted MFS family arabinose efflux permease
MTPEIPSAPESSNHMRLTRGMIALFSFCCGAIVANLYYAQPIIALIAPEMHMTPGTASLIVSLTQVGYALGMFFLVPLGDLVENRRLMLTTALISVVALAAASTAHHAATFLLVSLVLGFSTVTVQILVPLAAHMAPDETRGQVVGTIMGGLLLGILLARPISSFIAGHFGWRAVYWAATALMAGVTALLAVTMPTRRPAHKASYWQLIRSLGNLIVTMKVLRHRALYQALMFASFSLFWTTVPLELMRHYGLSQSGVALFALVGAIGATSAPIAGRLADAGFSKLGTFVALVVGTLSFVPNLIEGGFGVGGLIVTGVVLDFATQMNLVIGQREILALDSLSRNRLTAIYFTSIFLGGALGSAISSGIYETGGWRLSASVASLFPALALAHFLSTIRLRRSGQLAATAHSEK